MSTGMALTDMDARVPDVRRSGAIGSSEVLLARGIAIGGRASDLRCDILLRIAMRALYRRNLRRKECDCHDCA